MGQLLLSVLYARTQLQTQLSFAVTSNASGKAGVLVVYSTVIDTIHLWRSLLYHI